MKNQKGSDNRIFVRTFLATALVLLLVSAGAVLLFDPFYHYHGPLPGLKKVLNEKEYQVVGTLRHFEYDAVLAGSSVVENNDNELIDRAFDCTSIKAVRSYGGIADLCYFLDIAFEEQEVRKVFFNLDPAALTMEDTTTFESTGCPMYLYDRNPLNDVKYLFNKTVLFEKIPYMIAQSLNASYRESLSYNWAEGKDFSGGGALSHYYRRPETEEMLAEDTYEKETAANCALLVREAMEHPDTEFYVFIPPYSMLWWDDAVRSGMLDAYLYSEGMAMRALLDCPNVRLFDFQNETDIVTDLELYMDTLHFSPDINALLLQYMLDGHGEITKDTWKEAIETTASFARKNQGAMEALDREGALLYDN